MMRASGRLLSVAMERAISGTPQVVWREGRIAAEICRPSDPMLMFLLRHLNPGLFDSRDAANLRAHHLAEAQRCAEFRTFIKFCASSRCLISADVVRKAVNVFFRFVLKNSRKF